MNESLNFLKWWNLKMYLCLFEKNRILFSYFHIFNYVQIAFHRCCSSNTPGIQSVSDIALKMVAKCGHTCSVISGKSWNNKSTLHEYFQILFSKYLGNSSRYYFKLSTPAVFKNIKEIKCTKCAYFILTRLSNIKKQPPELSYF